MIYLSWYQSLLTVNTLFFELRLIWRFVRNDFWDTIVPCYTTFITAWIYENRHLQDFPLAFLMCTIYTMLYILTFCVANQVNSVEEDAINKPDRPLPAGLVNRRGAIIRLLIYNVFFIIVAYLFHVLLFAIAWQVITIILCGWGSKHWVTKNLICISAGTVALMGAEWQLTTPTISHNVWQFIIFLSIWAGFGLPVQDLRDQVGDAVMHRKTLPLQFGDLLSRKMLFIYFLTVSPILYYFAIVSQDNFSAWVIALIIAQYVYHGVVAYRVMRFRTSKADDKTYHYFVYLFIATIPVICFLK
nr:UbiA family prenyltransferase [Chitinophaga sp. sic0106]